MPSPRESKTDDHSELQKFQASLAELEARSCPHVHTQVQEVSKPPQHPQSARSQLRIADLLNPDSHAENEKHSDEVGGPPYTQVHFADARLDSVRARSVAGHHILTLESCITSRS